MENNMSEFVVISPLGRARSEPHAEMKRLASVVGRKVGFLWNQYPTTKDFWEQFEQALALAGRPSEVQRAYKKNTWMPLEKNRFTELAAQVDYFVVGVGA
jgi:hypothetical protein